MIRKIIVVKPEFANDQFYKFPQEELIVKKEEYHNDQLVYLVILPGDTKRHVAARCFDVVGERYVEEAPFEKLGVQKTQGPKDHDIDLILEKGIDCYESPGLERLLAAMLRVMTPEQLQSMKIDLKIR